MAHRPARFMVALLTPVVARTSTNVKVANFTGLYRHARSGRYYRYADFLKQLFDIELKDRIIAESPAKSLRLG